MTELAQRPLLGFPNTTVSLAVEGERNYRVTITDPVGQTQWVPTTEYEAKEMYFHPFVYGYNAPNLEYDGEDGA